MGSEDIARQNVLVGCEEVSQARWRQVVMHGALRLGCSRGVLILVGGPGSSFPLLTAQFSPRTEIVAGLQRATK